MKNKISYKVLWLVALLWAGTSCKDYLDINVNPNKPTQATAAGLLANATYQSGEISASAAGTSSNSASTAGTTSYYVQHLASPSGSASDQQFQIDLSTLWSDVYNVLADLDDMIQLAQLEGSTDYVGIGKILMAMNAGLATDIWGDIPLSEALQSEAILTPKYDAQEAVYTQIQQWLNEGIAELQKGGSKRTPTTDDFIHGGDTGKWIKTAYALKARYLNHLSKKASYDPAQILAAVEQSYTSNEEDAQSDAYSDQRFNPWARIAQENIGGILGGYLSRQIINTMNGTNYPLVDPRLEAFTDSLPGGVYEGSVNGLGVTEAKNVLTYETFYAAQTAPVLLVTYAEVKFIEAEAAFRTDKPRAYAAYLAGIRAHMDKMGVDPDEREAYVTNPNVSVGADNLTLGLIFKEKYVALFLQPEAWTDARRYNYQYVGFTPPANLNPDLNGQLIRRINYPSTEIQRNGRQVPTANVALQDPMWWDQP